MALHVVLPLKIEKCREMYGWDTPAAIERRKRQEEEGVVCWDVVNTLEATPLKQHVEITEINRCNDSSGEIEELEQKIASVSLGDECDLEDSFIDDTEIQDEEGETITAGRLSLEDAFELEDSFVKDECDSMLCSFSLEEYSKGFSQRKGVLVQRLFLDYNENIFDQQLPKDMEITWSKTLSKTAGRTFMSRKQSEFCARIELSLKVLDDAERVCQTLMHELCHVAVWVIDHARNPPHGPMFYRWGSMAEQVYPGLQVRTCHTYEIHFKYQWECLQCGHVFGRHSKSIDPTSQRCGCGGILKQVNATKKASGFALLVKKEYKRVRGLTQNHKEAMSILSQRWKEEKENCR